MSRLPSRTTGAPKKGGLAEDGEICPVCKSSRYLNPNMRFLVNPECYHKMCESCVDRLFSHGPAPCPIAGCKRTLRKAKFRSQTFEDIQVEREVDIRRRVARAMTKQESDFARLLDYNNYLETVEEITWNLILKTDVEETERKLRLWEETQKAELNPNAPARRTVDPATSRLSDTSHVVLKKGATQRGKTSSGAQDAMVDPTARDTGFHFPGLIKRKPPAPEKPFDPFDGWSYVPQHYSIQDGYTHHWFDAPRADPLHYGGGYKMQEYYSQALCEAFGGIGIFIEEELHGKGTSGHDSGTAVPAMDVEMSEVF